MSADIYRAAGQAVAAVMHGIALANADENGVELADCEPPHGRARILAEVAIGLAGIAAEGPYRFGHPGTGGFVVSWNFTQGELDDFAIVRDLVSILDPRDSEDTLYLAWRQAFNFVGQDAVWALIKRLANALARGPLDHDDIASIVESAALPSGTSL